MSAKVPRGSRNGNAVLGEEDVRRIRASSDSPQALAMIYGLGVETIRRIRRRETWSWLPDAPEGGGTPSDLPAASSADRLLELLKQDPESQPPEGELP